MDEHNELVNLYLNRDNDLKLNPKDQINNSLKKLNYNINKNYNDELKAYLKFNYINDLNKSDTIIDYEDWLNNFDKIDKFYYILSIDIKIIAIHPNIIPKIL